MSKARSRRTAVSVAGALLVSTLTTAALTSPTYADPPSELGQQTDLVMSRFFDIATDPDRGRAYVSGGGAIDAIEVLDEAARPAGTINIEHAEGLLLAPDGDTLYVGTSRDNNVIAVDLPTGEQTDYDLGVEVTEIRLTWAAGLVWFVGRGNSGRVVGSLDPRTGVAHPIDLTYGIDVMVASPTRPRTIVTGDGSFVGLYRVVTDGDAPDLELVRRREVSHSIHDLALTPDGGRVVVARGVYNYPVFRTRDLAAVDSYATERSANAVDISPDGDVAVDATFPGDSTGDPFPNHVNVYADGRTSAVAQHFLPREEYRDGRAGVAQHGLAWSDDLLYVVTLDGREENPIVGVVDGTTPAGRLTGTNRIAGPRFGDVVADPSTGRVFVTQGEFGNGLFVARRDAQLRRVVEHLPGANGMTLDESRHTLYVALSYGDAIAAVDTRTLKVRLIPTGEDSCPRSVALTGRRLWFNGGCLSFRGYLSALDLETGRVRRVTKEDGEETGEDLVTSPTSPRSLWATRPDYVSGDLLRYRVTRKGRPAAVLKSTVGVGPSQHSMQATPDGLHLVAALPALGYHPVLDPLDLAQLGASPSQLNPNSVAIRSDGLLGAGVDSNVPGSYGGSGPYEWTVAVSTTALGEPVQNVRLPLAAKIETQGATFGRRDLYTVAQADGDVVLRRHEMPAVRPITLTSGTAVYERGDQMRLVAHLEGRDARRARVAFYQVGKDGRRHLVDRSRADALGNASTQVRAHSRYAAVVTLRGEKQVSRLRLERL